MQKKRTKCMRKEDVVACVASVSSRGSSRKLGQEQKKTCFRSNFRAITRLETLATQAKDVVVSLFSVMTANSLCYSSVFTL